MPERENDALDALLEGSSLGTPAARRLRRRTSRGQAELARQLADSAEPTADGESANYAAAYQELTGRLRSDRAERAPGNAPARRRTASFQVELELMAHAVEILNAALSDPVDEQDTSADRPPSGREALAAELFADTMSDLRAEAVDLHDRLRKTWHLYAGTEDSLSMSLPPNHPDDVPRAYQRRYSPPGSRDVRGAAEHGAGTLRETAQRLERLEAALTAVRDILKETWTGDAADAALGRIDAVVEHAWRVRGALHETADALLLMDEALSTIEATNRIASSSTLAKPQPPEIYPHAGAGERSWNPERERETRVARVWAAP